MIDEKDDKNGIVAEESHITASRDELLVEEHLDQEPTVSAETDEDEIDSVRESLTRGDDDEDEYEQDTEEEESEEQHSPVPYYERVIMKNNGAKGARYENLRQKLGGKIALIVSDSPDQSDSHGFVFEWDKKELGIEKWSGGKAPKAKTTVILSKSDLESMLRGKLNPQIAMLSHKIDVQGDVGQAVYFFNLFRDRN